MRTLTIKIEVVDSQKLREALDLPEGHDFGDTIKMSIERSPATGIPNDSTVKEDLIINNLADLINHVMKSMSGGVLRG